MQQCLAIQATAPPRSAWGRFVGVEPLHPDARSWYQGALGEVVVGRFLARLGPGWVVLHSVPVGAHGSDIDHVVIGPGGVFTINTKHHRGHSVFVGGGAFLVNGQKTNYMRNAQFEGRRASQMLSRMAGTRIDVQPLIVVVGAARLRRGSKKVPLVVTLAVHELVPWLHSLRTVQSTSAVEAIAMLAEERGTWSDQVDPVDDALGTAQRFDALCGEVAQAGRARVRTVILGTLSPVLFAVAMGAASIISSALRGAGH